MKRGASVSVSAFAGAVVITVACTIGAVGSSKFANRVEEKVMSRCAGVILILVSIVSLILG